MNRFRLAAMAATLFATAGSQGVGESNAASDHQVASADPPPKVTQAPAAHANNRGLPPGALRAQMVEIMDTNGFERPLPAAFGFIPVGWRAQGGIQWGQQFMCTNGYNFNWVAQSPDGLQTVAILPQAKWETNNYGAGPSTPGCGSAQITSVQQYLQQLIARSPLGARVLDYRARPDIAARFRHLNVATPTAMGEMRTWVESGEAQFAFNQQGRDMRGILVATGVFSLMRSTGVNPGQTMDALTGFVFPGFAATAPNGQFNAQFAEAIRQSFLPNPAWEAQISRHNSAISRVAAEEIRKRGKAISETNDYISLLRQQTSDMRAKSDERRQREFGETIKGVETYDDANAPAGRVELSSMYNHAWRLNDGSYVLSNDAGFEPYRDLGVEGRHLERTQ